MTFIYIMVTVTCGYPIISGIATAAGLEADWAFYITRCADAFIYFWLPQINITIIRLIQGREFFNTELTRFSFPLALIPTFLIDYLQFSLVVRKLETSDGRKDCCNWRPMPLGSSIRRSIFKQNICMFLFYRRVCRYQWQSSGSPRSSTYPPCDTWHAACLWSP